MAERHTKKSTPGVVAVRRIGSRRLLPIGLLAAAVVLLVAGPGIVLRMQSDHVTTTAEERRIDLPDGSRIALAPSSAVAVSYDGGERRVKLLAGEAFFEVRPNVDRPFRVTAAGVEATVLGTSFDVRIQPDDVLVAVTEGRVRVSAGAMHGRSEDLVAGHTVRMSVDGTSRRGREDIDAIGSWRAGQLYAEGQSVGDAVDQLRRYFAGRIVISDGRLSERRVSGAFNLSDPESALRGIAAAHGATVRRITPWLLVLSP